MLVQCWVKKKMVFLIDMVKNEKERKFRINQCSGSGICEFFIGRAFKVPDKNKIVDILKVFLKEECSKIVIFNTSYGERNHELSWFVSIDRKQFTGLY